MSDTSFTLVPGVFLRLPQVQLVFPYGKATIYRMVKEGRFPKPVNIGAHAVAWRSDDIIALRDKLYADEWEPLMRGAPTSAKAGKVGV